MLSRLRLVGVLFILAAWALTVSPSTASVIADHFGIPAVSQLLWAPRIEGAGVRVRQNSGRLEVKLSRGARNDPKLGLFRAGYVSAGKLSGDFDLQVDYRLLTWPHGSGVRVGLETSCGGVQRTSRGRTDSPGSPPEVYDTNIGQPTDKEFWVSGAVKQLATQDRRGKLRLVRRGDRETGYFYRAGRWVEIGSSSVPTDDVRFALLVWSHDAYFTHQKVSVVFDNFVINSGTLVLAVP